MTTYTTELANLTLVSPSPAAHAPITLGWFTAAEGRETLLLMGNAEHEIEAPTLASETRILEEFVELERAGEQITWMLRYDGDIIGVGWIELVTNHRVRPPSVHLMIGNKAYRGRGIGTATMQALITYVKDVLHEDTVFSRHLVSNVAVTCMNQRLGFVHDGDAYTDENGLEWQNIILHIPETT